MSVIINLRKARKNTGLTQKEVAEALSISKDTLSRYERGKQEPRLEVAIQLSKFYKVSMDQLFELAY